MSSTANLMTTRVDTPAFPIAPAQVAAAFKMAGMAESLPPVMLKRPVHRRSRSTKNERLDVLREIRIVLQRGLTKSWASSTEFKTLARDFYAVAIGLSPGHVIRRFTLNQFQTALLAIELARIVNTSNILMINDPHSQALVVCHTLTLGRRLEHLGEDHTIFVAVDSGKPVTLIHPTLDLPWLGEARSAIREVLRTTSDQIVQTSVLGWSPALTQRRMATLTDWLIDQPVCYVLEDHNLPSGTISDLLTVEKFWQFSLRLDGHDPENDHTFAPCRIPNSIFASELASAEASSPIPADGVTHLHSFTAVQDRMQTKMFHSLNSIDPAANIWNEVSIITEG